MTVRRIALGLVAASLVVVSALGVVAAVVDRGAGGASGVPSPARGAPAWEGWQRVTVGETSYAVPPGWTHRPTAERVAYREGGGVIASGRGYAGGSVAGCPVAWAVLADPVRSSNPAGVVRATARAWARGYAGLPDRALPAVAVDGLRARVELPLGEASRCAGERAELTAVAAPVGDEVVVLVVARYLEVPGAPSDAAYDGVVDSLTVG